MAKYLPTIENWKLITVLLREYGISKLEERFDCKVCYDGSGSVEALKFEEAAYTAFVLRFGKEIHDEKENRRKRFAN